MMGTSWNMIKENLMKHVGNFMKHYGNFITYLKIHKTDLKQPFRHDQPLRLPHVNPSSWIFIL